MQGVEGARKKTDKSVFMELASSWEVGEADQEEDTLVKYIICDIVTQRKSRAGKEGECEEGHMILHWVARAGLTEKVILAKNQKEVRG